MYINALHWAKVILAIFVLLQYLYKIRIFFLALVVFPCLAQGQDSIVLPKDYTPVFNWEELNDSLVLEYQTLYPKTWQKDSAFVARKNAVFVDSVFYLQKDCTRYSFDYLNDSNFSTPTLSNLPPPNNNNSYVKPVPTWVYWVVLLVLIGLIFLKYANLKLFNLVFLSLLSPNYCNETLREHDTPINLYNLVATLLCVAVYSLFTYFIGKNFFIEQIHENPSVAFLLIFIAIAVFYLLRYLAIMIVAAVLDAEYVYSVLVQITISGNMWMALIILPAIALIHTIFFQGYQLTDFLFYSWIILMLYLVIKQVRVFVQTANNFPHSIVYLILYLCALEIAPYLVIYKLLVNKLG